MNEIKKQVTVLTSRVSEMNIWHSCFSRAIKVVGADTLPDADEELPAGNVFVLDLSHRPANSWEILNRRPGSFGFGLSGIPVFIVGEKIEDFKHVRLASCNVLGVFKHSRERSGFRKTAEHITRYLDTDSYKKIDEVSLQNDKSSIDIHFFNGRKFILPVNRIPELQDSIISSVAVRKDHYSFVVKLHDKKKVTIPWDLVLYHCDPSYKYFQKPARKDFAGMVAERVRRYRSEKGISTYELARKTGILRPNIARLEAGTVNPSLPTLEKIASALGIQVFQLIAK